MTKDIKVFCGYCEFAENCAKHFFECDKHKIFAKIAKDQHNSDIDLLKSVLNSLMVDTRDKAAIISLMEEE